MGTRRTTASPLVAERRRTLVADPFPQRDGPVELGVREEIALVELFGIEADRTDVIATTGVGVALEQARQGRTAVTGDPNGDAVEGHPHCLFGQEHERRSPRFGCANGDQERDGHLLWIL